MKKINVLLAAITLSSCSVASEKSIVVQEGEGERLIAENLSMTSDSLFKAYMSSNVELRRFAEMYVVGVLDSTEGKSWCGYKIASPNAIQEQVYAALKTAAGTSPKMRASTVIESHLMNLLPCKDA